MTGEEATRYRALAARANYLAPDRIAFQFATKELCRELAKPTLRRMGGIKEIGEVFEGGTHIRAGDREAGRVWGSEVLAGVC